MNHFSDGSKPDSEPIGGDGLSAPAPEGRARGQLAALTPEQQGLVSQHIGLVRMHLRNRVPTPNQPTRDREYEDLFQEGCVALARAAARYDPQRNGPFGPYALLRIRGAVHNALRERFSTDPVPARERQQSQSSPPAAGVLDHKSVFELANELAIGTSAGSASCDDETIGHLVRHRFERAVHLALADLQQRHWRRRNPCPIMGRIAAERLLIPSPSGRTALRQIAREAAISSGRVWAYERLLIETVRQHFQQDPQLPLLLGFAREGSAGFASVLDARRRQALSEVELDAFEARFTHLDRPARAELVYEMIERSTAAVAEIARNLYCLTASDESRPIAAVV